MRVLRVAVHLWCSKFVCAARGCPDSARGPAIPGRLKSQSLKR